VQACASTHFSGQPLKFVWDVPAGLPPVLGDANRLEQVFMNLFRNALEAGAEKLRISFRSRRGSLEATIEDDGQGCREEMLGRIFEPFYSTKGESRKRGLGLFIVNAILTDHRCEVAVRSKNVPDGSAHGLVFTLVFPSLFAIATKGPAPLIQHRARRMLSAA
jgi:signal transduction histidine kinase